MILQKKPETDCKEVALGGGGGVGSYLPHRPDGEFDQWKPDNKNNNHQNPEQIQRCTTGHLFKKGKKTLKTRQLRVVLTYTSV